MEGCFYGGGAMAMKQEIVDISKFKFDKDGLIPAVVQDYESGEVLMLVYMNKEAVEQTSEFSH